MLTIYKNLLYPESRLGMHRGARVLSVGEQDGEIVLWTLENTDMPPVIRKFVAYATGRAINPAVASARFVGTVQMKTGLVFHIFDLGES